MREHTTPQHSTWMRGARGAVCGLNSECLVQGSLSGNTSSWNSNPHLSDCWETVLSSGSSTRMTWGDRIKSTRCSRHINTLRLLCRRDQHGLWLCGFFLSVFFCNYWTPINFYDKHIGLPKTWEILWFIFEMVCSISEHVHVLFHSISLSMVWQMTQTGFGRK